MTTNTQKKAWQRIRARITAYAVVAAAALVLTGCAQKVSLSEAWTAEECARNLENALAQIDKYGARVEEKRKELTELERLGGYEKAANQLRIDISNLKQGQIAGNVQYIEEDVFGRCDKGAIDPVLIERVDKARALVNSEEASLETEDMPDLRVTNVTAAFVPYEETPENESCAGPFMDLKFTVANLGADFPRAVDWEKYANLRTQGQAASDPPPAPLVSISSDLDFASSGRHETEGTAAMQDEFHSGIFKSGETYTYETRVPVYDNETTLKVTARASSGHGLFETSKQGREQPFEKEFEIPIWDIYPSTAVTLRETDGEGRQTAQTTLYIGNKGKTATPGPIYGNYTVHVDEESPSVLGWAGNTGQGIPDHTASIPFVDDAATGVRTSSGAPSFAILGEEKTPRVPLPEDLVVKASVLPLCPNGKTGNLHDGDTSNNSRVLKTN